jgi:hypothetical protein
MQRTSDFMQAAHINSHKYELFGILSTLKVNFIQKNLKWGLYIKEWDNTWVYTIAKTNFTPNTSTKPYAQVSAVASINVCLYCDITALIVGSEIFL